METFLTPFLSLVRIATAVALVTAVLGASPVRADGEPEESFRLVNVQSLKEQSAARGSRLRASGGPEPDTVWLGHSRSNHFNATSNWWNLYVGTNRPGTNDPNNAIWDFDDFTGLQSNDSLQGWWPIRLMYFGLIGAPLADGDRPWSAIDFGNQINYAMPQGAGSKRTFGVKGLWHRDRGRLAPGGSGITWSPIAGAASAWCGMRQHGDNSEVETVGMGGDNNPFNQTIAEYNSEIISSSQITTLKRFPGYTSQMDQMLYRDIAMTNGQSLNVSFLYRTRMSTGADLTVITRAGWFHGDPRSLNTVTAGNFISSSAAPSGAGFSNGSAAPIDSFMVYLGSPVNDAACTYSDGAVEPVYDVQRRWFSEVLRINEPGVPYYELMSAFGNNPVDTASAAVSFSVLVPAAKISAILGSAGNPGRVRLVFRVKTNQGFDDAGFIRLVAVAGPYNSNGRGAALIDNVTINAGAGADIIGNFEDASGSGVNTIDNRITASPLTNWKSTGKPPAVYFHARDLSELTYADLCGPPDSPVRVCNIDGGVVSGGSFDTGESIADPRFPGTQEARYGFISPTINLVTSGPANSMGITPTIKDATGDYWVSYDLYAGVFNLPFSGNAWTFGAQSYPAIQANGTRVWGELRVLYFQIFNPEPQCFTDLEQLGGNSLIVADAAGYPDSLRLYFGINQQCYRFAISLACNPTDGAYFDNVSLGFVDQPEAQGVSSVAASAGTVSGTIWEFFNDAFPANETPGLPASANFDTASALIKSGYNTAQGTSGTFDRFAIPGDTIGVVGNVGGLGPIRMDLVFRILPGPGNHQIAAGRHFPPNVHTGGTNVLLQVPTNQSATVATGDASFWGQYLSTPGDFASPGAHFGGSSWDFLSWNSARCDSGETNFFRVGTRVGRVTPGFWSSMLHESDPHFATLGISKNTCFLIDTAAVIGSSNITCGTGTYPPIWVTTVPPSRTGYPGTTITKEYTKIIPDGLLTPGSHVQYFFRKCDTNTPTTFAMMPDTNLIYPQPLEASINTASLDGHRWQQFGVLPDRWKDVAFGGDGMACMLLVDGNDARGNERIWISAADSIGLTSSAKWGAHNGWHARGDFDYSGLNVGGDPSIAVWDKNQQPGTAFDLLNIKGASSVTVPMSFGDRLANRTNMGLAAGKEARIGPTPEMLRTFYRQVTLLTGDVFSGVLGPYVNRSSNDIALLTNFLTAAGGTAQPRGLWVIGDGFAQGETQAGGVLVSHLDFLHNMLGVQLQSGSVQSLVGALDGCIDLVPTTLDPNGDVYSVNNGCLYSNEVLLPNPGLPEATTVARYRFPGNPTLYSASVYKPATPTRNWTTLVDGWDIENLVSRFCETGRGRLNYLLAEYSAAFASVCGPTGAPILDVPGHSSRPLVDFMRILGNPVPAGGTIVEFALAKADRARIDVYDIGGRRIRRLADRDFAAGEHHLVWNGTDDEGHAVARGVYFTKATYRGGFASVRKLTVVR